MARIGFLTDDKGNPSSGRLGTMFTICTGCIILIGITVGEILEKEFPDNLYVAATTMALGGGAIKGFQRLTEREEIPINSQQQRDDLIQSLQEQVDTISTRNSNRKLTPLESIRNRGEL